MRKKECYKFMSGIDTIIFDFDGTLADTQEAIKRTFIDALQNIGMPVPSDTSINDISSKTMEEMFREVGVVKKSLLEKAVFQYCRLYRIIGPQKASLFPGVLKTLKKLREFNLSLAIATNERRTNLENLLPMLKLSHFFSFTICEDEVSHPKPHPEMVHKILDKLDSPPDRTLIVGDSEIDILTGKATHCKTCAVTYGPHPEEKLRSYSPDWLIDHFNAVLGIVDGSDMRKSLAAGSVH
jgi:HAD superfamily hydrolase (TIGR01509 family)